MPKIAVSLARYNELIHALRVYRRDTRGISYVTEVRNFARLCALSLLLIAAFAVSAQVAPPPLPLPDLSALPPAQRSALAELRGEFDKNIPRLTGEDRAVAYFQMGALYLRSGLVEAGNIALDHAIQAQPEDPRFIYLRGLAAMQQQQALPAAAAFAETIRLDPNYLPAHYHLAEIQMSQNNLTAARATLAPLLAQRSDLTPALALMGEIDLRERRFDQAVGNFERALKIESGATALYGRLALAHAGRNDETAAARARALVGDTSPLIADPLALELEGPGARAARGAAANAGAGAVAGPSPEVMKQRAALEQKVRAAPRDLGVRLALIEYLVVTGDLPAARGHLLTAKTQAPANGKVIAAEALIAEAAGDDAAARSLLGRAIAAEPGLPGIQVRYGDLLMRAGQPGEAFPRYLAAAGSAGDTEALASAIAAASLSGRCAEVLPVLHQHAVGRPKDGALAQIEVRAVSSCASASAADRSRALSTARALYRQNPDGEIAEALAMALAANNQSKEAIDFEAEAIFDANKRGDGPSLAGRRAWMKQFESGRAVARPWPDGNLLLAPPALRASAAPPTAVPVVNATPTVTPEPQRASDEFAPKR